jgi:hypothetical protein
VNLSNKCMTKDFRRDFRHGCTVIFDMVSQFSAFLRCPHNCIFEDSAGHNGPVRPRNTNLSGLSSETMWSQPILIELLAVLLLLQTHMHFPSRNLSPFSLRTCLNSS